MSHHRICKCACLVPLTTYDVTIADVDSTICGCHTFTSPEGDPIGNNEDTLLAVDGTYSITTRSSFPSDHVTDICDGVTKVFEHDVWSQDDPPCSGSVASTTTKYVLAISLFLDCDGCITRAVVTARERSSVCTGTILSASIAFDSGIGLWQVGSEISNTNNCHATSSDGGVATGGTVTVTDQGI